MKPDRSIDAMIAEHVMQTEKYWAIRWGGSGYGDFPTYDEAVIHALKIFGDRRAIIIPYWDEPCYSTDIAAAWLVVEKLAKEGDEHPTCIQKGLPAFGDHATPFEVYKNYAGYPGWTCYFHDYEVCAHADTAPLAICKAALAACGVKYE